MKRFTWQQYAEERGFDFEKAYNDRLNGMSWEAATGHTKSTNMIRRLLEDWCHDNGKDYQKLLGETAVIVIDSVEEVDKGKVIALANAKWPVSAIAVDCHCTERCVNEVLHPSAGKKEDGSRTD